MISEFFTPQVIVGLASATAAIGIIFLTIYYQKRNLEFKALLHIHEILTDPENREERETLYNAWEDAVVENKKFKNLDDIYQRKFFRDAAERVMNDWDEIGLIIYKKLNLKNLEQKQKPKGYIDKDIILTAYSGAIMNSWAILNHYIKNERQSRETPYLKIYFLQLYRDAKKFMDRDCLPVPKFYRLAMEKNLLVLE